MKMSWILESNRQWHLLGGFVLSVFFTFFCGLGTAIGLEYKDVVYHDSELRPWQYSFWATWDWLDFSATLIGALGGQIIQGLIIWLL